MRLKVSNKEALLKIDSLIEKGFILIKEDRKKSNSIGQIDNWFEETARVLKAVFTDFAPIYKFLRPHYPEDLRPFEPEKTQWSRSQSGDIQPAVDTLLSYYDEIGKYDNSPLRFNSKKAAIWLYDICCQLEPESNEAEICRYMFKFAYGEYKEISQIHKFILGEDHNPKAKNGKTVLNALEGVNSKTKEIFGFTLFTKKKSVVALSIPAPFILGRP